MKNMFSKISSGAIGLALTLVCIGAVTMIFKNLRVRADMTAERLYTLTQGSRDILKQLDKTVVLKFYFSSSSAEMPQALK
ncbi:MAG: Gldg family protein, partial [Kiritimatiellae bacterium]|nr:Gldg family protein [Kiritimatiellia bacterium]